MKKTKITKNRYDGFFEAKERYIRKKMKPFITFCILIVIVFLVVIVTIPTFYQLGIIK